MLYLLKIMGRFLIPERKAESEMIKIIKPGYKKKIECQKCGALLSYDEKRMLRMRVLKVLPQIV